MSRLSEESWNCDLKLGSREPWGERYRSRYRSNVPGEVSSRYFEERGTVGRYVPISSKEVGTLVPKYVPNSFEKLGTYVLEKLGTYVPNSSFLAQIKTGKDNVGLGSRCDVSCDGSCEGRGRRSTSGLLEVCFGSLVKTAIALKQCEI